MLHTLLTYFHQHFNVIMSKYLFFIASAIIGMSPAYLFEKPGARTYDVTYSTYRSLLLEEDEDLDSWLLRKKQPHIDEEELKRKNKRNALRSFESTDIRWYVGVVTLSVYHCALHL